MCRRKTSKLLYKYYEKVFAEFEKTEEGKQYFAAQKEKAMARIRAINQKTVKLPPLGGNEIETSFQ